MVNKRETLIELNKNLIQIPMPDLSKMTNEELERRLFLLEGAFDDDNEDEDL